MKKNKLLTLLVMVTTVTTILIISCKKELSSSNAVPPGKNQLQVMLTDDPSQLFDSIFLDIQRVEIKVEDSAGIERWDSLNIRTGVYNILNFRNGLDTLLGTGFIPNGRVEKVRITLGSNNFVMFKGITTPPVIPAGMNVITLGVDDDVDHVDHNHIRLWLDFDGLGSIELHNGKLELKLHLSHFSNHNAGELEGKIKPSAAFPVVIKAISGSDTLTAIPEHEGEFKIRGIKTSNAKLIIIPSNGYKDSVINNIQIRQGNDTDLGTIVLHR